MRFAAAALLVLASCAGESDNGSLATEDSVAADTSDSTDTTTPVADTGTTIADSSAADSVTTTDVAADADPYGAYPPGPYGTKVGQTLAPLDWVGYVNLKGDAVSTTKTYGPTSLDALRRTGKGYGLLHLSEYG